ncbi:DNA-dependent ATPase of the nucleotide excision repair factor 4 complex [Actinomortierella ambigua]|uniref:DNA 5'-3' helicase n=1 Tax=Actinomortierella ambigua TaxID=1343610 RepID=A0A9P6QMV9_9FUNG|nr:DNA-dependent ATPase of the nucleotide excision repair factor 4 complex [Actinomortierella ambigua]KAG0270708.1 DNA-dependent ATPase of the nucleotide excision repair factor 4 complex [Actinomortierella ambigua]
MLFEIDGLPVRFPYDRIYPEQYAYMCSLKQALDAKGHGVLEMPSGTGKTVTLLSLILAYQQYYPDKKKLIYCSRTVPEIEKALAELKRLVAYRKSQGLNEKILGLGLTSRRNLCLHPSVSREKKGKVVDARCRNLTASWVREKAQEGQDIELCSFYETLETKDASDWLEDAIYTLDDIKTIGKTKGICPYYLARRLIGQADVIIFSYHYLLDPKIADLITKELSANSIVVFDEAHNIDNVCIDSLSIDIMRPTLEASSKSINKLSEKIEEMKQSGSEKLKEEYNRLVQGLQDTMHARDEDLVMASPVLPDDVLHEAVPGNIRKAEHFVAFLKRFNEYLKTRLRVLNVTAETPASFLRHLKEITFIEPKPLRYCTERLSNLIWTLELYNLDELSSLIRVAALATLVATYDKGFMLVLEPFETDNATVPNPILRLACLDASIAIKPIFERFSSVVITSGTLSPLEMYPKILGFDATVQETFPMTLTRNCFLPMVITRGSDQVAISSKFEVRNDPAVVRNFGNILIEYAKIVPDGVVAFFPSYLYMESIISMWHEMGILTEAWKHKLIFVETPDSAETSIALDNYRRACENGRGAILLAVARGKVSEGIDFDHHYGRAVIMFGIPYQYTESRILKARLEFMRDEHRVRENDFLTFDALRHAAQCLGRVLRGKTDYGLMVFADRRYARQDKRSKLPKWINQYITDTSVNLSTDMGIAIAKKFLRSMAQPLETQAQLGVSLWTLEDVLARQQAQRERIERGAVAAASGSHMAHHAEARLLQQEQARGAVYMDVS